MIQNECHLTGEINERIALQWTQKRFTYVDFFKKILKTDHYKQKVTQFIRCICYGPQAIYIAEKIERRETVSVKGSLDTRCQSFGDEFYYEVSVSVIQCYWVRHKF